MADDLEVHEYQMARAQRVNVVRHVDGRIVVLDDNPYVLETHAA